MDKLFLNETHHELRSLARKLVEREFLPHADEWEDQSFFPPSVFTRLGEMGLLGMRCPVEYGGQGLDIFSVMCLLEELIRAGSGGPAYGVAVHSEIVLPLLQRCGSEDQKQRYLVPGIKGDKVGCLGVTEPDAGSDVAAVRTRAERTPDGWMLNGAKTFITNGVRADFAVVLARTQAGGGHRGLSQFIVEKGTPGFKVVRQLKKVGLHSSDTAELSFEDVHLPADAVLGQEGRGFQQMMAGFQTERIVAATLDTARAQLALETAKAYAQVRQAFGKTLSEIQVIRHKLADMATQVEATRRFLYTLAWEVEQGNYPVGPISMLKLMAARVSFEVADEAVQIHGGYGYMQEYPVQRLWRDARVSRIAAGSDEIMRDIIAKELLDRS